MKLLLIRHAEAVDLGPDHATDFDRPLTPHGVAQADALGATLKRLGILPTVIATSPLVRARQTADALAAVLMPGVEPFLTDRLGLGELRPKKLSQDLAGLLGDVTLAVGHMPDIATYAGWLLGASPDAIDFKKCCVAGLTVRGDDWKGTARLDFLVPPSWFLPDSAG